jgi:lipopolysaccharide assembly outer membrane protein LptD (OstA)
LKIWLNLILVITTISFTPLSAANQTQNLLAKLGVNISADSVNFNNLKGNLEASGNVVASYGTMTIYCDHIAINQLTGEFSAADQVKIVNGNAVATGNAVHGNMKTQIFYTEDLSISEDHIFAKIGKAVKYPSKGLHTTPEEQKLADSIVFTNVKSSTCDYLPEGHEHYSITADKVIYKKSGYARAENVVLRLKDVPILWLPYLWTSGSERLGLKYKIGYDSQFGGFLLTSMPMQFNRYVSSKFHLNLYSKRGIWLGADTTIKTDKSTTKIDLSYIHDHDTEVTDTINGQDYNNRFDAEDDRYRLKITHHSKLSESFSFDANLDLLSDIQALEEWWEDEYDDIHQPASQVTLTFLKENLAMSLSARPKINDFYTVVEKAPELKMDIMRTELGHSGVFYQSNTSLAHLHMKWRETDLDRKIDPATGLPLEELEDYHTTRFDTMHSLYLPLHYNNWLNITPRAGARFTYYSDSSKNRVNIQALNNNLDVANPDNVSGRERVTNYDDLGGELFRFTGELGLEMNFKSYRTWYGFQNEYFRLDGLRHVVEPYINIVSVLNPTEDKDHIYMFDEVDRIDELNFIRFGTKQRFQSRRNKQAYTFATLENYADFHATTRDNIDHLGDFGTRFNVAIDERISLWSRLLVSMDRFSINDFEVGTTFGDPNTLETTISYLFRDDYKGAPVGSMNSQMADFSSNSFFERNYFASHSLDLGFRFPINEKLRANIDFYFDLEDGKLVEQSYEILRDMHCWTAGLRLGLDDGDFEVSVMLYLKGLDSYSWENLSLYEAPNSASTTGSATATDATATQ